MVSTKTIVKYLYGDHIVKLNTIKKNLRMFLGLHGSYLNFMTVYYDQRKYYDVISRV